MRGLLGVADQEVDVVEALDRERVVRDVVVDGADQLVDVDVLAWSAACGRSIAWVIVATPSVPAPALVGGVLWRGSLVPASLGNCRAFWWSGCAFGMVMRP